MRGEEHARFNRLTMMFIFFITGITSSANERPTDAVGAYALTGECGLRVHMMVQ